MSSGLAKPNTIINPFAKTVLSLKINDQLQHELKSEMPPQDVAKVLTNIAIDLIFGYVQQYVKFNIDGGVEVPDGHDKHEKVSG